MGFEYRKCNMSSGFVKKAGLTWQGGGEPFFSLKIGAAL